MLIFSCTVQSRQTGEVTSQSIVSKDKISGVGSYKSLVLYSVYLTIATVRLVF